jgi:hypothetical protein
MLYRVDEREVAESPKVQGVNEDRAYSFDFTQAGAATINSATVALYDWSAATPTDVSATKLSSAAATVAGLVVTMSGKVQDLIDGTEYRLFCRATHDGGQVSELYCRLFGKV